MTDLPAGSELVALVATKVMEWKSRTMRNKWGAISFWWKAPDGSQVKKETWRPDTDIATAWEALDHVPKSDALDVILVEEIRTLGYEKLHHMPSTDMALAICRAALKVVEANASYDAWLRCPACGFSPVEEARYTPQTDMPRTQEEVIDAFEVCGADEGNVLCPECSCEFNLSTGKDMSS